MQIRGLPSTEQCTSCRQGSGPFKHCVFLFSPVVDISWCANCHYNSRREQCDLWKQHRAEPRGPPDAGPPEQTSSIPVNSPRGASTPQERTEQRLEPQRPPDAGPPEQTCSIPVNSQTQGPAPPATATAASGKDDDDAAQRGGSGRRKLPTSRPPLDGLQRSSQHVSTTLPSLRAGSHGPNPPHPPSAPPAATNQQQPASTMQPGSSTTFPFGFPFPPHAHPVATYYEQQPASAGQSATSSANAPITSNVFNLVLMPPSEMRSLAGSLRSAAHSLDQSAAAIEVAESRGRRRRR